MGIEAWFMDDGNQDPRLPHHSNPNQFVSLDQLAELGVLYWKLNPNDYENDDELRNIREARGYNYMDLLDLCPEKVENYEEKLKNFYTEHIHQDEEIRYCLEGSGYFDVRDKEDRWIRIWIKAGDLIILPAGIYHRFTLDTRNYVKLMRLFMGNRCGLHIIGHRRITLLDKNTLRASLRRWARHWQLIRALNDIHI